MLTGLVIALLATSWATTVWSLERAADARALLAAGRPRPRHLPTRLAERATPRPVPDALPLPDWAREPGPAAMSACRRTTLVGDHWPDPPVPAFAPQHRCRPDGHLPLTTAVAAGWDAHEAAHRPTTELAVLVISD